MSITNLTPHAVYLVDETGEIARSWPPCVTPARVNLETRNSDPVDGVPVKHALNLGVINLPAPRTGVYLIVSSVVRAARPNRGDLLTPGGLVRDSHGRVIGCQHFIRNTPVDELFRHA